MKANLPAAGRPRRGFWRTCRVYFRRFRITVWLVILGLLGVLLYLTQIGLPDFAKKPLLEDLHARGLDLRFSRLRLSWHYGVVAENVRFGRAEEPLTPELTAALVQLRLNHRALVRLQLQIDSLLVRQGRLVWELTETNQPPRRLALENIQTELSFLPDDEWSLEHFTAAFAGARIQLSGTVVHASAIRDWKVLKTEQAAPAGTWRERFRDFADLMERMRFAAPPTLRLDIKGDARDLASFGVRVVLSAPGAETPWGTATQARFSARLFPATTNGLSRAELSIEASDARTRWGATTNMQLTARLSGFESLARPGHGDVTLCAERVETEWGKAADVQVTVHGNAVEGQTNLVNADLTVAAGHVETSWISATNVQFNAQWLHALTNAIPLGGLGRLTCRDANTRWGSSRELRLNLRLAAPPTSAPPRADESWGWWAGLEPYAVDWDGGLGGVQSHGIEAQELTGGGSWRAPELAITNLHAVLLERALDLKAGLDVASRALRLSFASNVDPHAFAPALPEEPRRALGSISWPQPPELKGEATLTLPAWTNRQPDWRVEVQPTVHLQGELRLPQGLAYRGATISALQSRILYSDHVWQLPDLTVLRPEGTLEALVEADEQTRDFHLRVSSTLDPRFVRPALEPELQKGLDVFTFTEPPVVGADVWGNLDDLEGIGIKGRAALTNFTFRGESASGLQTSMEYTNRFLHLIQPRLQRGDQRMSADGVGADFGSEMVFITNGFSTAEPMVIARAIGAHVARAIEAYHFQQPPSAHVYGMVPMHGEERADLHFELDGGPFDWWRFHLPRIVGHLHWRGEQLSLTNVWADFYGGEARGSAHFDFHPKREDEYRFDLAVTNAILPHLVRDVFGYTNRLEGRLWGTLVITNANTLSLQTWEGHGTLNLRDGFIWEIPIFGIFSDVLNSMMPGLGSSRATAGTCTYIVTNGIIRTDDLEIQSTGMRLDYRGTVDFEGQVRARVDAGLFRNMWLVGPVFSTVFWPVTKLFEYKVSGPLGEPKAEPVYLLPKVMLLPFQLPFHPLRTLRGLFPENLGNGPTNAPPLTSPKQN